MVVSIIDVGRCWAGAGRSAQMLGGASGWHVDGCRHAAAQPVWFTPLRAAQLGDSMSQPCHKQIWLEFGPLQQVLAAGWLSHTTYCGVGPLFRAAVIWPHVCQQIDLGWIWQAVIFQRNGLHVRVRAGCASRPRHFASAEWAGLWSQVWPLHHIHHQFSCNVTLGSEALSCLWCQHCDGHTHYQAGRHYEACELIV